MRQHQSPLRSARRVSPALKLGFRPSSRPTKRDLLNQSLSVLGNTCLVHLSARLTQPAATKESVKSLPPRADGTENNGTAFVVCGLKSRAGAQAHLIQAVVRGESPKHYLAAKWRNLVLIGEQILPRKLNGACIILTIGMEIHVLHGTTSKTTTGTDILAT